MALFAPPAFSEIDFSKPQPFDGMPQKEAPIPGVATEYILRQKFRMSRNAYDAAGPMPLNTKHYLYPDYLLVEEGPRRNSGVGDIVEFEQTYAQIPATHYEFPQISYNFIGTTIAIPPGANNPTLVTRNRKSRGVKSMVRYDYFLVPNPGGAPIATLDPLTGDNYNVSGPGDIEDILEMQYVFQNTIGGATYGGIFLATDQLNLAASALPTWPTSEQYQAMIADALQNKWNATVTIVKLFPTSTLAGAPIPNAGHMAGVVDVANSPRGGLLPAEVSRTDRWMGNIWQRATRYVQAW